MISSDSHCAKIKSLFLFCSVYPELTVVSSKWGISFQSNQTPSSRSNDRPLESLTVLWWKSCRKPNSYCIPVGNLSHYLSRVFGLKMLFAKQSSALKCELDKTPSCYMSCNCTTVQSSKVFVHAFSVIPCHLRSFTCLWGTNGYFHISWPLSGWPSHDGISPQKFIVNHGFLGQFVYARCLIYELENTDVGLISWRIQIIIRSTLSIRNSDLP